MKYTLLSFLLLIAGLQTQAQTWFPNGAMWHYYWMNGSLFGYIRIEVVGASTVDGHACKTLERTQETYYDGNYYQSSIGSLQVYDSVGVVWIYVPSLAAFDTLYNFNAAIGERWGLAQQPTSDPLSYAEVVDTGTVVIDAVPLR